VLEAEWPIDLVTSVITRSSRCAIQPHVLRAHEALVYDDDQTLVDRVGAFLTEGAPDVPTVAVLTSRHWAILKESIGPEAAGRVAFTDCDDFYVRPITALARYSTTLRQLRESGGHSVRVTGEFPEVATQRETDRWTEYEAILNRAFAGAPASILCLYDSRAVPDRMIEGVYRTHPHVNGSENRRYHGPERVVAAPGPPPPPLQGLRSLPAEADPVKFREHLAAVLAAERISEARTVDMLVAAGEVFENACRYGGGPRDVRAGRSAGWFVCEISDRGPGLDDPFGGYLPPSPELNRGAGLWVARQLVSNLELYSSDAGATIRLWL
jgi:anti-sigma regulatory factor (Ser/Thr protein kinase)